MFRYFGSWDEMVWHVHVDNYNFYQCNIPWGERVLMRQTIELLCSGDVYCWNGTCTPNPGSSNWGKMLTPDNVMCYLAFENKADETMFILRFGEQYIRHTFSSGSAAWYAVRQ